MVQGRARWALGVLLALQALGAIAGAIFVVPAMPISGLKTSVFSDYTIPALGLGVIVGGGSLVALALLVARSRFAALAAGCAGLAVMVFEIVEVTAMTDTIFTDPGSVPLWQQPLWFAIGAVILLLAVLGSRQRKILLRMSAQS